MKDRVIVFIKSFAIAFALAALLQIMGLINSEQMLNIALPGIFLVVSFILLFRMRVRHAIEKQKKRVEALHKQKDEDSKPALKSTHKNN